MEPTYISAFKVIGNNAMYVASNGNIYEHSGGTIAWRNNNPGNMRDYPFARRHGAIGVGGGATNELPGFSIFPDINIGWNAMVNLLSSDNYQKQ